MKVGRILSVLCLGLSTILCSCSSDSDKSILSTAISQIEMKANGHMEHLVDYDGPYTICYKNEDKTYSLYIFASPIQYKAENGEYEIIDNTVIESSKEGFAFENKANDIKTFFPKTLSESFRVEKGNDFIEFKPNWDIEGFFEAKQIIFTNMYNDKVSSVIYERGDMDLVFYPTKAGIKLEIVLKEKPDSNKFSFAVKSGAVSCENKNNGYILFKDGDIIQNVIYQPLVQYKADKGRQLDVTTQMKIKREGGDYLAEMIIDESIVSNKKTKYPIKLDPSFEMYLNKMPDSTVYSKHDINNYLANYTIVGKHPTFGEGWHYVRFRLNFFFHANEEDIKLVDYYVRSLYSSKNIPTSLHRAESQWSSTEILWSDRINGMDIISDRVKGKNGYYPYQITNFVKDCVGAFSWETETIGVLLKACDQKKGYQILATADHTLYSPYILINLKAIPTSFEIKENINENRN